MGQRGRLLAGGHDHPRDRPGPVPRPHREGGPLAGILGIQPRRHTSWLTPITKVSRSTGRYWCTPKSTSDCPVGAYPGTFPLLVGHSNGRKVAPQLRHVNQLLSASAEFGGLMRGVWLRQVIPYWKTTPGWVRQVTRLDRPCRAARSHTRVRPLRRGRLCARAVTATAACERQGSRRRVGDRGPRISRTGPKANRDCRATNDACRHGVASDLNRLLVGLPRPSTAACADYPVAALSAAVPHVCRGAGGVERRSDQRGLSHQRCRLDRRRPGPDGDLPGSCP